MKDEDIPVAECFLCRSQFKFGYHHYHGRYVPQLQISICQSCERGNWDGIVPSDRLNNHFRERGIIVRPNKKGWIDIPPIGLA
jgi:hypothetical protein